MASQHMKTLQVKTTRYYHTPTERLKLKRQIQNMQSNWNSLSLPVGIQISTTFQKTVWQNLLKINTDRSLLLLRCTLSNYAFNLGSTCLMFVSPTCLSALQRQETCLFNSPLFCQSPPYPVQYRCLLNLSVVKSSDCLPGLRAWELALKSSNRRSLQTVKCPFCRGDSCKDQKVF